MALRVLGLDLSLTATGIAYPNGHLWTLKPHRTGDHRLREISSRIAVENRKDPAHFVVIEDLPFGMRNAAAGALGMLHGAVRARLMAQDGVPYLTVPPATLKTYACGSGRATKADMRMAFYQRTGADVADDNQVDAAFLRLLGLDLAGSPELQLPASHRRALRKLCLPEGVAV